MAKYVATSELMEDLLGNGDEISLPTPGVLTEGTVIDVWKNKILVDLDGLATGIITGHEAYDSMGTAKSIEPGDLVSAYILEEENEDGLVVLSLRKASQQKTWAKYVDAFEGDKVIKVKATEANKGGLLLNVDGIKGFIPVSQLAPLHYPRVNGADSAEILRRLQKLVGLELEVKILNLDRDGGKLILSERAAEAEARKAAMDKLEVGTKVNGKISGIVNFGIFVTFNGLEGLVHISEIAWGHVKDPNEYGKLGDKVEVLVIGKERDKISLSMKQLTPDPWEKVADTFKIGKMVKGKVNRVTPFGAFVSLAEDINGLIHVSEIAEGENIDPNQHVHVGDEIEARIISLDAEERRVGLSLKPEGSSKKEEAKSEETE